MNDNKLMPKVCDIVLIINSNNNDPYEQYRVNGYMKSWELPPSGDNLLENILNEGNREFDMGKGKTRLVWCVESEAEYVCLTGRLNPTVPIENVSVVGRVNWSDELINDEQKRAMALVGTVLF